MAIIFSEKYILLFEGAFFYGHGEQDNIEERYMFDINEHCLPLFLTGTYLNVF